MLHLSHIACFSLSLLEFISTTIYLHHYLSLVSLSLSLSLFLHGFIRTTNYLSVCVRVSASLPPLHLPFSNSSFCNSQHRHRQGNSNDEDEEGYATDSGSVMTDYTSDTYNDNYSSAYDDYDGGENSEWQEFWDEQAQGKYWYNNISGNLTVSFH